MATFDAQSGNVASNNTTVAAGHTIGAGANRLLLVGVTIGDVNNNGASVSGITLGATALTPSISVLNDAVIDGIVVQEELWYLIAPASGLDTITVTLTAAAHVMFFSASFSDVDQTNPLGGVLVNTASNTNSITTNVTGTDASSIVWDGTGIAEGTLPAGITPGTGQTERGELAVTGDPNGVRGNASTEAGGGTITMSQSTAIVANFAQIAVEVRSPGAAGTGGAPSNRVMIGH
jgi:hypothetical protein